jgi:hypothetical protein
MRNFAVVVILLVGVIAPLDVAASFVINSSVHIPALPVLVVVGAWEAQRVAKARDQAMAKDILTLHASVSRLRLLRDIPRSWTNFSLTCLRTGRAFASMIPFEV